MKKAFALMLAVIMLLCTVVGCGSKGNDTSNSDKVVVYINDIFNTMCPYETTANSDQVVFDQVYEPLAITQDDGTVKGCLAENWTISDDSLVYTFNLKKDVKFHNDEVMTSADVVYSFNKFMETAAKKNFVDMIEKVEAPDENTVVITLTQVTPLFLVYLNEVTIMNEKFCSENSDLSTVACGTGPYKLVSIDPATAAQLTRFDGYHEAPAAIKDVELRYVGDDSTAAVQLESHKIDIMRLDPSQMSTIESKDEFKVEKVQTLKTAVIDINVTREPLNNKALRQALSYATDRASIIEIAYEGLAVPARLQANDNNCFGVNFSKSTDFSYNPEKAKACLAEAGYPDGINLSDFNIILDVMGGTYLEKAAQVLQQNWHDVGIEVELRNTSTPDEDAESGNYSLMTQSMSYRADFSYNECHYGTSGIGGNNFSQLSDAHIDEEFKKAAVENDPATREAIYTDLIAYIIDLCPTIPLFHHELVYAWNTRLDACVHSSAVHPYYVYEWSFVEA